MRKVKFVIIALMAVLFSGTMLFVSCQKEGVSPSSTNGSNAVIENSPKSAGSAWTYGEPVWYDEAGLPRWSENYPRIVLTERISNKGHPVVYYFYNFNDYEIISRQITQCKILDWKGKYNRDLVAVCLERGCDCFPEVWIIDVKNEKTLPEGTYTIIVRHENDGFIQ